MVAIGGTVRASKHFIKAPADQTLILRMPPESSSRGPEVEESANALLQFIDQAAEILTESLRAGPLEAAIIQGSGFCGAMAWEGEAADRRQRLLLSPEEITASMTLRLLEEAPDE